MAINNQNKLLFLILFFACYIQLTSCATQNVDDVSQYQKGAQARNGKSGQVKSPDSQLDIKVEDDTEGVRVLEDNKTENFAIQGNIEYINDGRTNVFDVESFRKILDVDEKPAGIALNFENAEIKEVISLVIGKIMKENYLIDPAVKGTITLKTETPLNKDTVFYMLENVLDMYNARIVKRKGHYRILPMSKPGMSLLGFGDIDSRTKLGYGYRIVPLKYISSAEMVKILESVTDKNTAIRADEKRNLLIIGGTSEDVKNMLDAVSMFDVDWMKGTSVALIKVNYSDVNDVIDDLNKMLLAKKKELEAGGILTLEAIERLNSILVITKQYEYIRRIKEWVRELDVPTQGVGSRLYVYRVKNSTAGELAATLSELFSVEATVEDGAPGEITGPGSKPVTLSEWGKTPAKKEEQKSSDIKEPVGEKGAEGIRIIAAEDTNILLISATPNQYAKIELALGKLDTPPLQVLIEVSIMDVQLTDDFSYGMQWFFEHGTATSGGSGTIGDVLNFPQTFSYSAVRSGGDIRSLLGLLASDGKVDVLSSPSLLVRNNRKASIRVGDQQPVSTSVVNETGTVIATSVEYKDTGVILEIKPSITSSGTINVSITQEVIDVGAIDDATGQRTFLNRNLNSTVSVSNGETIILGGLIRTNSSVAKSGVPWLRDIPILGFLFGKTITSDVRSELIIMLSPKIIRNPEENNKVLEEYKDKFKYLKVPG